jgi:tetratricopeptide (TPR) repeat protein
MTIREAVTLAHRLLMENKLAEAEELCHTILAAAPRNAAGLHVLGLVRRRQGNSASAVDLLATAAEVNPLSVAILTDYGVVLNSTARTEDALAQYERVLSLQPNHLPALNNRGNALRKLSRPDEALASLDQALAIKPDYPDALSNRGDVLSDLNRNEEAIAAYDTCLALVPLHANAWSGRGQSLVVLGRYSEAIASFDRALGISPDSVSVLNNKAIALRKANRQPEALDCLRLAREIEPRSPLVNYNLGNVLGDVGRYHDAIESFDRVLAVEPDNVEALNSRGLALRSLNRDDQALMAFITAQSFQANFAEAHFNEALIHLRQGDLLRGFAKYEWRWSVRQAAARAPRLPGLIWGGQSVRSKTVLLYSEQGFGDTLQFVRYAPLVAERGASVVLAVQAPLVRLLSGMEGVASVVSREDRTPDYDFHCPLLSLPAAFKTEVPSIPARVPYIAAPEERRDAWRDRLAPARGLRVAVAWSGSRTHAGDRHRSLPLPRLLPLLSTSGVQFVSIQRDVRSEDAACLAETTNLIHVGEQLEDFCDTAAVLSSSDLVITADTSVAHLAGAMGRPVWIMLPFSPDFRWMHASSASPWYPTARLFRQAAVGDWNGVLDEVANALTALVVRASPQG